MESDKGNDFIMRFQGGALEALGMRAAEDNPRECGVLFVGDGKRAEGTYFSWSDGESVLVTISDFLVLEDALHSTEYPPFIAIRHDSGRYPGRNRLAMFCETGRRSASSRLSAGMRWHHVEMVYFEPYFAQSGERGRPLREVAAVLEGNGEGFAWSPEIALPFETVEGFRGSGLCLELALRGAADMVMAQILRMEGNLSDERDDRQAIAAVVEYIDRNLDKPIRQEGLLGMAGMSSTKFKRAFHKYTGKSMSEYIASQRIARAKSALSRGDSVGKAAALSGFATAEGFATAFKKATGQTPSQWKKRSRFAAMPPTEEAVMGICN